MSQVVPGVARVELSYTIPNNTVKNVFHVKATVGRFTITMMDAVKAAFENWFSTSASPNLSDQLALYDILITDLTDLAGFRKDYPISPPLDGNLNAEYLPANVTFAIKAFIATRGRGTNGRVFWPALVDTQVTNQQMKLVNADDIVNALELLRTAMAAVPSISGLCIPHFMVGGVRPPVVTSDLVTSFNYSDLWLDSQRDRLPEHKKHKKPRTP